MASVPLIADCSVIESGLARSVVNVRTVFDNRFGFRTTAVTQSPASTAWANNWRPIPPVAAMIVRFIVSLEIRRRARSPIRGMSTRGDQGPVGLRQTLVLADRHNRRGTRASCREHPPEVLGPASPGESGRAELLAN